MLRVIGAQMIINENLLSFFDGLPQKSVAKNNHLCFKSSKNHHLYVLLHGCLKAYYINDNFQEIVRSFYFPGDIIGLDSLYRKQANFNIQAMKKSNVVMIHEQTSHNMKFLT